MRTIFTLTLGLLILLLSCDNGRQLFLSENKLSKKDKHPKLISFQYHYLREFNETEFDNPKLAKTKITWNRNSDTLNINVELPWDGCANLDGDIVISNDSIILNYWLRYEELCTELVYYELNYKLKDTTNINYKLKLEYLDK